MKFCTNCGKQLDDAIRFCPDCGTALDAKLLAAQDQEDLGKEKKCLDLFYRFTKFERLAWKIGGIYYLVYPALLSLLGVLMLLLTGDSAGELDIMTGTMYIIMAIYMLPLGIVNLVMVKRCERCMNTLYINAAPLVARCNSIGLIVLGAIFNNVAMAFFLVNFIRAKNDAQLLKKIVARQKAYRSGNT